MIIYFPCCIIETLLTKRGKQEKTDRTPSRPQIRSTRMIYYPTPSRSIYTSPGRDATHDLIQSLSPLISRNISAQVGSFSFGNLGIYDFEIDTGSSLVYESSNHVGSIHTKPLSPFVNRYQITLIRETLPYLALLDRSSDDQGISVPALRENEASIQNRAQIFGKPYPAKYPIVNGKAGHAYSIQPIPNSWD